ncbi:myocardin-related transcription factor B isoform X1 [Ictalurus punctatus]|uniref:Myocardin-related transcription factor B isoform X1 n=1 Tax=Ictalurus punctatus TaxID=7998 RepID=A0A2D0S9A5_ICTPU|nr:myocardin-related transcription factor B isoform X1 [Ictalurus punctatus]XP_047015381.1 myocardin-related transcription factor B isoform X1 [Ictalurus punctatus]
MNAQGEAGAGGLLVPSPQSEAVTHEMEELSLQPSQNLPPLNERKNVLQLRLQQRRTREQLVDQGIMPPLKSPAAFHEQIRSLERARTENFLKHKIRSRPERAELVRMHILQETVAEPSLQATQLKLKRARLADDLNEKIAQRPGPMELVEKNILPVASSLKEAIIDGQMHYPKTQEFDEDSSDAFSPEQPGSQESHGSVPSPGESKAMEASSPLPTNLIPHCPPVTQVTDFLKPYSTSEQTVSPPAPQPQPITTPPSKSVLSLIKQSQPKTASDKSRSKKNKEAKPRVKKLKYHQYIPPDQKQEPSEAPMDSSYARLLQQQQLFLQLQILSQQQQQHYNYQTILPAPLKPVIEGQNSSATVAINSAQSLPASIVVSLPPAALVRPNSTLSNRKAGTLPANLEEMKVAELKMELKLRGLPVSGTKTDLIERLKPYQESAASIPNANLNAQTCGTSMEVSSTTTCLSPAQQPPETQSSTPPVSPISSEVHNREDVMEGQLETHCQSRGGSGQPAAIPEEQDRRLHEKQRQIEELLRKLEQEQRLVEKLKMQLEVEKRSAQNSTESNSSISQAASLLTVKTESPVIPNCTLASRSTPSVVKLEKSHAAPVTATPLPQFFISHQGVPQVIGQPQTLLTTQHTGTQILLPVSLPNNTTTIQLTNTNVKLQPVLQAAVSPQGQGLIQTTPLHPAKAESSSPQPVHHNNIVQTLPMCSSAGTAFQFGASEKQAGLEMPRCFPSSSPENALSAQTSPVASSLTNGPLNKSPSQVSPAFILPSPAFSHAPKSREPPPYEDAVKQTRSLQAAAITQFPTATSQQMDDLFDILIESGEITPFSQQEPSVPKLMPVTASITTLPVNTALSRPPAQVQMAPPPALLVEPMPSLASLASDNQLEALLEGTLGCEGEPEHRTLGLLEELHSQLLDQPHSPMDTSELSFNEPSAPLSSTSSFSLQDTGMDSMEWLDLTMPRPIGPLDPLGIGSDFLDAHDLHLHWD